MSKRTTPVVVFADLEPWQCFAQFGAALRRHGVRAERVTARERGLARRVEDLLLRPIFSASSAVLDASGAGLGQVLGDRVVAVEAVEQVAEQLSREPAPERLGKTGSPELEPLLYDKLAMTRYAEGLGLFVPLSWAATEAPASTGPFLVKPRLGAGGQGVRVLADRAAYDDALPALGDDVLVQEWVPGEILHVAGIASRGAVLQAACYAEIAPPVTEQGPPSEVEIISHPEMLEQATRLLAGLGYTGSFCLDYVRRADGRPLLLDVNSRLFGSWLALQLAGLDMVGAYLHLLGLRAEAPSGAARVGARRSLLPPNPSLRGVPAVLPAVQEQLRTIVGLRPLLGSRWAAVIGTRLLLVAALETVRRLTGRGRPGRQDGALHEPPAPAPVPGEVSA